MSIKDKTEANLKRISGTHYSASIVYEMSDHWPGDYVGRAILALVSHYKISQQIPPNLKEIIGLLPSKLNKDGYLGPLLDLTAINEQQLSGHSWFLRGLLEYYEAFKDEYILSVCKSIIYNLYLPIKEKIKDYPIVRNNNNVGGVSGESTSIINGWLLSSDIGCAFISLDGISHYYQLSKDSNVKKLLDAMIDVHNKIDFVTLKCQTHATLSSARGILRLFETTNEKKYLDRVIEIFDLYIEKGMTLNFENYNWFSRIDTWTEPCAVVDSFILAAKLYELTKDEKYKTLARRIYFNGLSFSQRSNGGAGPNTCVTLKNKILKVSMYEADFCCTMRYAEGLFYINKYARLLNWNDKKEIEIDKFGRRFVDDRLIVKIDDKIVPIFTPLNLDEQEIENLKIGIIF